jgi:hemoglobin
MSSEAAKPTLYDRLGGVYSIAAVVDDLIERVMHNPVLNANAAVDEAHHRVSAAGFKYYVTEMVCWAAGGPQNYTGRAMRESHEHLKITESEFAAFCKDFDDTMAKFNVPEVEHKELFAVVQSTKGDIVTG